MDRRLTIKSTGSSAPGPRRVVDPADLAGLGRVDPELELGEGMGRLGWWQVDGVALQMPGGGGKPGDGGAEASGFDLTFFGDIYGDTDT